MAASHDLRSRVTGVVTCPICLELFNGPKFLPCLHTFCLKCIEGHCRNNDPGDEMSCPVCRQNFIIPVGGVSGLVSNFFIAGLVEAKRTAVDVAAQVPCEVCLLECDQNDSSDVAVCTMYCVDCSQKLCEPCSRPHRRMKGGPHKVVPIGSEVETELVRSHGGKCDKHRTDNVRLYCFDCKMNICVICFAEEHQQHMCKNVDAVAGEFVKQIDADLETIHTRAGGARDEVSRLDEVKRKFLSGIEDVRDKLMKRAEELKQFIDEQVKELMVKVLSLKTEQIKEIESFKNSIETRLLAFETFSAYCSELKTKGKPCDITRAANDLHTRATELLQNDVIPDGYCAPAVTFKPMNIHELLNAGQNLIGQITVVHTLPQAEYVCGMTSLDDKLYVLRHKDKEQVDVYNTTTTTTTSHILLRRLSVPGVGHGLCDITSCKHYRCLYVADSGSNCVHRVDLNDDVTKLSVKNKPWSLSVTPQFTVLVTSHWDSKLVELTTEGKQLRVINLQSDIVHPWHAIQLSNGQFVVSHGRPVDPVHRVCIVGTNGHVTQSYGGPRGSATVGQLNVPCHLTVDKDRFIVVAETNNRRVLLLSQTLSFVSEIVSSDELKQEPRSVFLNVDTRLLCVADGCRVLGVQL